MGNSSSGSSTPTYGYMVVPPPPPGVLYPENGLAPNRQDPLQAHNVMAPWVVNRPPVIQSPFPVPYYVNEMNLGRRSAIPAPYGVGCGNRKFLPMANFFALIHRSVAA